MAAESLVQQLLDEILDSGRTPEEVCGACPELLPEVRRRWRQMCASRRSSMRSSRCRGTAPTPIPPLSGQAGADLPRIPGYDVEALLGRGGMGVVYKARHRRLNRLVALKMLIAGAYAGPPERARFQREAEAVASLHHANIVAVYDVGDHEGCPYFTMELLEGGSLAQALAGTPQPARQAAALADHAGRGRAGGAPGRDRAPRPEAGQHPAHGRWHAQGRRFRAGAALRGRAGADIERRPDRDSQLHGPRAGDREGGDDRAGRGHLRPRRPAL